MEPMMSEDQAGSSKPPDPFEQFRSMRDAYLDGMAKVMAEAVNTEAYALKRGHARKLSYDFSPLPGSGGEVHAASVAAAFIAI